MRVTERIVAWDALLVCLILIRLLGLHGQAQLGIVSSLWIDFDCVPHRACEYIYIYVYYVYVRTNIAEQIAGSIIGVCIGPL